LLERLLENIQRLPVSTIPNGMNTQLVIVLNRQSGNRFHFIQRRCVKAGAVWKVGIWLK